MEKTMTEALTFQSPAFVEARQNVVQSRQLLKRSLWITLASSGIFLWQRSWNTLPVFLLPCLASGGILYYKKSQEKHCIKTHLSLASQIFQQTKIPDIKNSLLRVDTYLQHSASYSPLKNHLAYLSDGLVNMLELRISTDDEKIQKTVDWQFRRWLEAATEVTSKHIKGDRVLSKDAWVTFTKLPTTPKDQFGF
jgi:hypothetical protein